MWSGRLQATREASRCLPYYDWSMIDRGTRPQDMARRMIERLRLEEANLHVGTPLEVNGIDKAHLGLFVGQNQRMGADALTEEPDGA